ncbi:MAG TPA: EF-hand domain-containing protein [Rhizomicrobium sp.]|jgi:Ca2+-binding EF-hand superfamily protein|nr:EF-hand domain-containing protein [Rhizomicrobium sp.]
MTRNTKIALLLSAAVLFGGSTLAYAHMDGPMPPDGPMQGLLHRGKLSDRMLAEFDANKDGKVTRAEFNNVLGTRFAAATHKQPGMTEDQFIAIHQDEFKQHVAEMFRRIDWNGDGKLSLDEFAAPQRAHFQMMDRDGTGSVSCGSTVHADYRSGGSDDGADRGRRRGDWHGGGHGPGGFARGGYEHRSSGGSGFGRARFCGDADITRDGTVTRPEFDNVMAKHFQAASGGAAYLTLASFTADMAVHYHDMNDKMFQRLDKDGDGKLSIAEFAASPLKMFARLDHDHDGVITADEMKPHFHSRSHGDWDHGRGGDHSSGDE